MGGRNYACKMVECEYFVTDFFVFKILFCKSQKQPVVHTGLLLGTPKRQL